MTRGKTIRGAAVKMPRISEFVAVKLTMLYYIPWCILLMVINFCTCFRFDSEQYSAVENFEITYAVKSSFYTSSNSN